MIWSVGRQRGKAEQRELPEAWQQSPGKTSWPFHFRRCVRLQRQRLEVVTAERKPRRIVERIGLLRNGSKVRRLHHSSVTENLGFQHEGPTSSTRGLDWRLDCVGFGFVPFAAKDLEDRRSLGDLDSGVSASIFESVQSLQKGMKQEHIQGSSMSHSRRFGLLLPGSPTVTPVGQWSPTRCTPAVVSSR